MEFYLLLSPIIIALVLFTIVFGKKRYYEITFYPAAAVFTIVGLTALFMHSYYTDELTKDYEYHGFYGVKVVYYEDYETYVVKECSRTVYYDCGRDSKGNTIQCSRVEYYDCSECEYTPEKFILIDNSGHEYSITKSDYYSIVKKWNVPQNRVELNRNINYHYGCGKDGDMYYAMYNGEIELSINITRKVPYVNKIKNIQTVYKFEDISSADAKKIGLHEYPDIKNLYQPSMIGFKKLTFLNSKINKIDYINSHLGASKKVRVYVLAYYNKSVSISSKQQSYWQNGNKNELVICVGLDSNTNKINWVNVFSWSEDKMVEVKTRTEILGLKYFNNFTIDSAYNIITNNINTHWHKKSFKDFDYIEVDMPDSYYNTLLTMTIIFDLLYILVFLYVYNDVDINRFIGKQKRWN